MVMKILSIPLFLLFSTQIIAQPNPEVYVGDFEYSDGGITIQNLKNVSQSPFYDNQPSFLPDGSGFLYASIRPDESSLDIRQYNFDSDTNTWITDLPGGEYSPTVMPDQNYFSVIRSEPEQLLWKIPLAEGEASVLVPNEIIGYHTWYDESTLYTFVLSEPFTFVEFKLGDKIQREVIAENPGRSIHKVPGKNEVSFVDKSDSTNWVVKTYSPGEQMFKTLVSTPEISEDMFWIDGETFLIGEGNNLMVWNEVAGYTGPYKIFDDESGQITRLALSPNRDKIALVFVTE
ncbi:MAG: hypothetical protein CL670_03555 [Balneola sp.]|jgi:hypothetical protein|nr:hypothetical protein [Balneola sp.]MBE78206.1 hypothetical protein [Balneola sp.]|tara:strand:+ start:812 stop:1678 length:867 start_codon:yes stop_codon:yes gene_type:complete